jgi:uncharacterized protein (DUF2267 family)
MTTATTTENLSYVYEQIKRDANLRTNDHARRWSEATLRTLGLNLDRGTKKALGKALPKELEVPLRRAFWLIHFREPALPAVAFQKAVARRAGATDAQFARKPIVAVFRQLKGLIEDDLGRRVGEALPSEVRQLWEEA